MCFMLLCCVLCRSHPEEVRKFYQLVDEFHRMWDVVTEFDSLSNLATQMVPVSQSCSGCLQLAACPSTYGLAGCQVVRPACLLWCCYGSAS